MVDDSLHSRALVKRGVKHLSSAFYLGVRPQWWLTTLPKQDESSLCCVTPPGVAVGVSRIKFLCAPPLFRWVDASGLVLRLRLCSAWVTGQVRRSGLECLRHPSLPGRLPLVVSEFRQ